MDAFTTTRAGRLAQKNGALADPGGILNVPGLDFLFLIPRYFIYVAMAAGLLTFAGFLRAIGRLFFFYGRRVTSQS